jgi:hypothetical protein
VAGCQASLGDFVEIQITYPTRIMLGLARRCPNCIPTGEESVASWHRGMLRKSQQVNSGDEQDMWCKERPWMNAEQHSMPLSAIHPYLLHDLQRLGCRDEPRRCPTCQLDAAAAAFLPIGHRTWCDGAIESPPKPGALQNKHDEVE